MVTKSQCHAFDVPQLMANALVLYIRQPCTSWSTEGQIDRIQCKVCVILAPRTVRVGGKGFIQSLVT